MAYTVMKIGEHDCSGYSDAGNFSLPNNPDIFDSGLVTQREIKELPMQRVHMMIDQGGLRPRTIMLKGYFIGSTSLASMNTLANHVFNTGLKRLYFSSTRFYYCFGRDLKHTYQSGRTNFKDYVATFITPIPFAYSDTGEYERWTISTANATTMSSLNDDGQDEGAFKNDGSAPAHILEWTITNKGSANITKVELGDAAISASAVQGNKITWEGTLAQNKILKIYLFRVVTDAGIRIFKKLYYTADGTFQGSRDFDGNEPPYIAAGASDQSFSVRLTGNNGNSYVRADWRDTYWI